MSDRVNENRIIGETRLQPIQKVLNMLAEHINHTRFAEGESQIKSNNREVTVSFKEGMLVKDILKLLGENDVNTDISDYGRRLSDLGYLLYQEPAVQASQKAQEFARSIYEVGQAIIPEKKREVSFQDYKISNDSKEYKRELFLWALGKGQNDSSYSKIRKQVPNTATEANTEKERREKIYWDRKNFLLDIFLRKVEEGNLDSENALERTFISAAEQAVVHILKISGTENIIENLKLPIDYTEKAKETVQYIRNNAADIFGSNQDKVIDPLNAISKQLDIPSTTNNFIIKINLNTLRSCISPSYANREEIELRLREIVSGYRSIGNGVIKILENVPDLDKDITPIFRAVEGLSNSTEWKGMSQIDKVRSIWEICQGYKYAETYSIEKAISIREFECQIVSWVAGELMQKYIKDIKIAAVHENAHTMLAFKIDSGIYVFDANMKISGSFSVDKAVYQKSYMQFGIELGLTADRKLLLEKFFRAGIEDYISTTDTAGYFSVGDFDKTIIVGLLNNTVSSFVTDAEIQKSIYRLILDIEPNDVSYWINLGRVLEGQEKIYCYRKALSINPNDASTWINLGQVLDGQEAIDCYRNALRIDPYNWMAAYNVTVHIAIKYPNAEYQGESIDFILNWKGHMPAVYNGDTRWQERFDENKQVIRNNYP